MKSKTFSHKRLREFGYAMFRKIHVSERLYTVVVDELVETSLRGVDSHGVRLIPHYVEAAIVGRINKKPKFSFKKTAPSTGIFDADHGYGIAAGVRAMDKAIDLAKKVGIGGVVVKNSSHFGAAAIYGLCAAKKDMIGMAFTDVDALVFPHGGKQTYFGTNPICFCAPMAGEEPFCLDMATSRVPFNKIRAYAAQKKMLEAGWAFDKEGNPTTDPERAVSPAPMGDYKGYGLAAVVSIFSSLLSGMPFGPHIHHMFPLDGKKRFLGHFFLALDIAAFTPVQVFKASMRRVAEELRRVTPRNATFPVMVPGDPEKRCYRERIKQGIPVADSDALIFKELSRELGIKNNVF